MIQTRRAANPTRPLIRVSSTFFWHLSSDYELKPISSLEKLAIELHASDSDLPNYPSMKVGHQVEQYVVPSQYMICNILSLSTSGNSVTSHLWPEHSSYLT